MVALADLPRASLLSECLESHAGRPRTALPVIHLQALVHSSFAWVLKDNGRIKCIADA